MAGRAEAQRRRRTGLLGVEELSRDDDPDYAGGDIAGKGWRAEHADRQRPDSLPSDSIPFDRIGWDVSPSSHSSDDNEVSSKPMAAREAAAAQTDASLAERAVAVRGGRTQGRKASRGGETTASPTNASGSTPRSFDLPPDVLKMVLRCACAASALPVAAVGRCVCRAWRQGVLDTPELWRKLDLSYGWCRPSDSSLIKCIDAEAWAKVTHLNVSGCGQLTDKALKHIAESCASLTSLNISHCSKFSLEGISEAIKSMAALAVIDVSGITTKPVRKGAIDTLMQVIATSVGPRLTELVAEHCSHLSKGVQYCCDVSNLKTLALSASGDLLGRISLPIEDLQQSCPLLERLLINGLGGMYGWNPGLLPPIRSSANEAGRPRFARLIVAEIGTCQTVMLSGTQLGSSYLTDSVLERLLHGSHKLEELDIAGSRVTLEGLSHIPEDAPLRRLNVPRSSAASDDCMEFIACVFAETLRELDAGHAGNRITDQSLEVLRTCSNLVSLDVTSTAVTNYGVRRMLEPHLSREVECSTTSAYPRLTAFGLSSCRGISRDLRTAASQGVPALISACRALRR